LELRKLKRQVIEMNKLFGQKLADKKKLNEEIEEKLAAKFEQEAHVRKLAEDVRTGKYGQIKDRKRDESRSEFQERFTALVRERLPYVHPSWIYGTLNYDL
jgi:hypothetical protein